VNLNYPVCKIDAEMTLNLKIYLGPQGYEEAISFANWDVFWYTRGFPSMDTERSRRHASKLLTYPITIGGTLHQHSGLTLKNQRLTPEGSRSLAGKRTYLPISET
jgi:splicing suppressor protein 51